MANPSTTPPPPNVPPLEQALDGLVNVVTELVRPDPIELEVAAELVLVALGRICPACRKLREPTMCGHAFHEQPAPEGGPGVDALDRCRRELELAGSNAYVAVGREDLAAVIAIAPYICAEAVDG